jgi:hypothetical protein
MDRAAGPSAVLDVKHEPPLLGHSVGARGHSLSNRPHDTCRVVPHNYATVFSHNKAGMEGVDKEKVKTITYNMSKVGFCLQSMLLW